MITKRAGSPVQTADGYRRAIEQILRQTRVAYSDVTEVLGSASEWRAFYAFGSGEPEDELRFTVAVPRGEDEVRVVCAGQVTDRTGLSRDVLVDLAEFIQRICWDMRYHLPGIQNGIRPPLDSTADLRDFQLRVQWVDEADALQIRAAMPASALFCGEALGYVIGTLFGLADTGLAMVSRMATAGSGASPSRRPRKSPIARVS